MAEQIIDIVGASNISFYGASLFVAIVVVFTGALNERGNKTATFWYVVVGFLIFTLGAKALDWVFTQPETLLMMVTLFVSLALLTSATILGKRLNKRG